MDVPETNIFILKRVKGIPKYDSLPMYRFRASEGIKERRSLVLAWKYQIELEIFRKSEPTDSIYTIQSNTYYAGHDHNELYEYEYPDLENTAGITHVYIKDDGRVYIKNTDDPEWEIKDKYKLYNSETDITKWKVILEGLQQYYRHECYYNGLVE